MLTVQGLVDEMGLDLVAGQEGAGVEDECFVRGAAEQLGGASEQLLAAAGVSGRLTAIAISR